MDAIDVNLDPGVQNGYNIDNANTATNQPDYNIVFCST
jgi:hypothetical protein